MAIELKEWLNSITYNKKDLSEHTKSYPAYIVNKILSGDMGCVCLVNELNKRYTMPPAMQYKFLLHSVPKKKRFNPYVKKTKDEDIEVIKQYFGINTEKAKEYLSLLDTEQIQSIKLQLFKGGVL